MSNRFELSSSASLLNILPFLFYLFKPRCAALIVDRLRCDHERGFKGWKRSVEGRLTLEIYLGFAKLDLTVYKFAVYNE